MGDTVPTVGAFRRSVALALLLLAVAAAISFGVSRWRAPENTAQLILLGNVDIRQVNLAFKVDGRIAAMHVDEGDAVKAGQVVASLEKADFEDRLGLAKALVAAPEAALARLEAGTRPEEIRVAKAIVEEQRALVENARRTLNRVETLAEEGVTPHQQHDDAAANLRVAEARLRSAQESLELATIGPRVEDIEQARAELSAAHARFALAERRLTDADLRAPNAGVVLTRVREPGAIVAAGETIYLLSLSSPIWVRSFVPEPDLSRIRPGMSAQISTDSGRRYTGHVGFISPTAEFTPKSVETSEIRTSLVYRLRVIVDSADTALKQGMPVTVTVSADGYRS